MDRATLNGPSDVNASNSSTLLALGDGGVALLVDPTSTILTHYGSLSDADVTRLTEQAMVAGAPHAGTTTFTQSLRPNGAPSKAIPYRFYATPLLVKNVVFGTLIVGVPDRAPAQLHRLLATLLIAAPITLVIAAAGGFWLASRAMRPVRLIAGTARSIGATDLSQRLNLPNRDELGDLAATFDQMLDRLEAAFQRQRRFTSDAGHELRTPLTIVQLELEHARTGSSLSPDVMRALNIIQGENEHMSRLVNDLLILARADSGRAVLGHERLDLSELALNAVERLGALAREQHIALELGDLPDLCVAGDATYLTQMLINVIENAIRYTSGYGHSVRIATGDRAASGKPTAWVRVTDDGPGIASEHLPHLFERFYRVDESRQDIALNGDQPGFERGGSGLGLSIVRWVAQSHGGDVRIESEVGQGSSVEIWLPLASPIEESLATTDAGDALTNGTIEPSG